MSKTNSAVLEAKMIASRGSLPFVLPIYRPGANPAKDTFIETAIAVSVEGESWTRRFRVPRERRPAEFV